MILVGEIVPLLPVVVIVLVARRLSEGLHAYARGVASDLGELVSTESMSSPGRRDGRAWRVPTCWSPGDLRV